MSTSPSQRPEGTAGRFMGRKPSRAFTMSGHIASTDHTTPNHSSIRDSSTPLPTTRSRSSTLPSALQRWVSSTIALSPTKAGASKTPSTEAGNELGAQTTEPSSPTEQTPPEKDTSADVSGHARVLLGSTVESEPPAQAIQLALHGPGEIAPTAEKQFLQRVGSTGAVNDELERTADDESAENTVQVQRRLMPLAEQSFTDPDSISRSRVPPPNSKDSPILSNAVASAQATFISRRMVTREVVSHLVTHGCQDLSGRLDLSSFDEYPISHGGFSDIYQGQLRDGTKVAVKALRVSIDSINQDPTHLKHAARELHTWVKCKHPNVIPLLGLAIFRDRIGMVAPWMGHGTLPHYLKKVPGANRFNMCVQICEALSYLHGIGIIHCDLKGANVLVSDEGTPSLTDFGTSLLADRTLGFTQTNSGPSFTLRWSAAEIIEETSPHTEASDVYALGMTIYETMTGKVPYNGKSESNVIRLVTVKKALPERPECMSADDKKANTLWELLVWCWSYEPAARPSAAKVKDTMKEIAPV
ncbi:hypothetical protein RSAG8_04694, partial [Rhizoctonia solani AG-8 WAC10335]